MWQKFIAGACVMTGALGFGWSLCGEMSSQIWHLKQQKQILLYIAVRLPICIDQWKKFLT